MSPGGGPRLLLRRLREIMAEQTSAQMRLDKLVTVIASNMVAEVCSIYLRRAGKVLELFATEGLNRAAEIKYSDLTHDAVVAKVSIIGIGMRAHPGVASTMFRTLSDKGINIQVISTSEIKVSVLIAEEYVELAVRALHSAYELDAA